MAYHIGFNKQGRSCLQGGPALADGLPQRFQLRLQAQALVAEDCLPINTSTNTERELPNVSCITAQLLPIREGAITSSISLYTTLFHTHISLTAKRPSLGRLKPC